MAGSGRRKADDALMLALARGDTVAGAAEAASVAERMVYRRLADADFCRRVTELRAAMVQRALGRLADASVEAVDTLRRLLTAGTDSTRLGAAKAILELGTRLRESVELEQRLAAIEQQATHGNGQCRFGRG